jgi:hypothetical protein
MIKSAGEIIATEIGEAVEALKGCVTPIFDVNENGEAELLGSGVLIKIADDTFICTAKHVIDEGANSTLYIDGPSKMEILEGDFYGSKEHDVAVLKLTPEQTKNFQKYTALRPDQIASPGKASACKYVELVGFPETQNRRVYQQNKIKGLIYSVGCAVIEISCTKVRVSFNRKRNIDRKTRRRVTAPDPHGMSGGAMFGAVVNAETIEGKPRPKLIGIATDWLKSSNEILGSSAAIVKKLGGTYLSSTE